MRTGVSATFVRRSGQTRTSGIPQTILLRKCPSLMTIQQIQAKSKDVKEQVASSLLHGMTPNKDGDIALKTGGRRLRVRLSPKDKQANILTHEQMDKFHSKVTRRDKKSKLLGQGIRKIYGRKSVTPYYAEMKLKRKKNGLIFRHHQSQV